MRSNATKPKKKTAADNRGFYLRKKASKGERLSDLEQRELSEFNKSHRSYRGHAALPSFAALPAVSSLPPKPDVATPSAEEGRGAETEGEGSPSVDLPPLDVPSASSDAPPPPEEPRSGVNVLAAQLFTAWSLRTAPAFMAMAGVPPEAQGELMTRVSTTCASQALVLLDRYFPDTGLPSPETVVGGMLVFGLGGPYALEYIEKRQAQKAAEAVEQPIITPPPAEPAPDVAVAEGQLERESDDEPSPLRPRGRKEPLDVSGSY